MVLLMVVAGISETPAVPGFLKPLVGERAVEVLGRGYFGNPLWQYGASAGLFCIVWTLTWLFKTVVVARLEVLAKKTAGDFDDFMIREIARLRFWFYCSLSLFFATRHLVLPDALHAGLRYFLVVTFAVHAIRFLHHLVSYGIEKGYAQRVGSDPSHQFTVRTIQVVAKWILWSGGLIFILDNLGFDITAAVAGLGIGGVAVALAAQAILGDLFSAFSIFIDKPFVVGDTIIVGDLRGTVERIGLKTTRVRNLDGDQLIFSNADLTASRIRNLKRMAERRVILRLGVTYQTAQAKLARIPALLKELVEAVPGTRFERAHFAAFGDFALVFEVAYRVLSHDFLKHMDAQHAVNLAIKERFDAERIEFAYPTQTLFLAKPEPPALPS